MPEDQVRSPIYNAEGSNTSSFHVNNCHESDNMTNIQCDVLIIGAGLAGLSTALSLPPHLNIAVLAKEDWQACSSHYAQGGIAAVIDSEDTVDEHVSDTLIAGDGLCDVDATTQILAQGANAIDWLLKHDVPFTTHTQGENIDADLTKNATLADLHLTKEGGHGRRRVAHADDATGKHIMQALHQQALAASNITVYPYHEALSLLTATSVTSRLTKDNHLIKESHLPKESRCVGAQVIDTKANQLIQFNSQAVVLASGGLGQLFSRATAPNVCVGDGIMMAWEAGCRLANLEFIQFHPTGLMYQDENGTNSNFLISEAVRGEGGFLRCPITHKRFMPAYDAREELAPRDIVARAIANEIANNGLGYVHLDISHKLAAFIREHFPDIYAHCLSLGIDITTSPIPVAPTAHYTCGGVVTTAEGKTDVKGLYAAGEVANTGLHGANRLASNSLLECVVVGRAIAANIPHYIADSSQWNRFGDFTDNNTQSIVSLDTLTAVNSLKANDLELIELTTVSELKTLMTNHMGIRRSAAELNRALQSVLACRKLATQNVADKDFDISAFRWQRLLTLASLLLQSALTREESRGGHSRHDYPNTSPTATMSIIEPLSASMTSESALAQRLSSKQESTSTKPTTKPTQLEGVKPPPIKTVLPLEQTA